MKHIFGNIKKSNYSKNCSILFFSVYIFLSPNEATAKNHQSHIQTTTFKYLAMGNSLEIRVNNPKQVYGDDFDYNEFALGAEFENLLEKHNAVEGEPELKQIGRLTNTDVSSIYNMLEGEVFIDNVLNTVNALIKKLSVFENLEKKLTDNGFDSIGNDYYFKDFNIEKGNGYVGNNFGRDLRVFKRFLDYAKSKGTKNVSFNYPE